MRIVILLTVLIFIAGCGVSSKVIKEANVIENNRDVFILSQLIRGYLKKNNELELNLNELMKTDTLGRISNNFDKIQLKARGGYISPCVGISKKSVSSILENFRLKQIHKWRISIEELSARLNPVIRGVMNYYCISSVKTTVYLWNQVNLRLFKWVQWEKSLPKEAALKWLRMKYRQKPDLFPYWKLVNP